MGASQISCFEFQALVSARSILKRRWRAIDRRNSGLHDLACRAMLTGHSDAVGGRPVFALMAALQPLWFISRRRP
jgi:hypothetical protein